LVVNLLHDSLFHGRVLEASLSPPPTRQETTPSSGEADGPTITLTGVKRKVAGLRVERARMEALPSEVGVSGRIEATPERRIDVRPGVAGVVREVHVALGQVVKKGEPLATLDSAEVATARLDIRARQRDLIIARTEGDWRKTIAANVAELIPSLRKGTSAAALEKQFADRPLGSNRAVLLQAYSEYEIAAHEEEKQRDLLRQKIVGEHPAFLALHAREGAQAKYESCSSRSATTPRSRCAWETRRSGSPSPPSSTRRNGSASSGSPRMSPGWSPTPRPLPDRWTRPTR
jgi:multidrug efflux pump subunit AcrA (membrane-fusion protein)